MISRHVTLLKASFTVIGAGTVVAVALTSLNANSPANAPAAHLPLLGPQVPASLRSILTRACEDCHSANTNWPWYSKVPPLSWQIHRDVAQGRSFMDLSKWSEYTENERMGYLMSIVAATQTRVMPPTKYVWLHRDARLSDAELRSLQAWALAETKAIAAKRRAPRTEPVNE